MTKTTNEQWEYLFEIIQKSETKYTKARQQVLAFGARIGLEERQKLFQIRDQQATITWPLAMQILNTLPTTAPYRLGAKAATYDRHTRRSMDTSYSQFLQKRILGRCQHLAGRP